MVTSCDPAGVRNASSGYRTACAVPLLWWALPDGLRRAAFVVDVTGRLALWRFCGGRYRTACAVPLLWWMLPDGLRRAAFVVGVTGRLEMCRFCGGSYRTV